MPGLTAHGAELVKNTLRGLTSEVRLLDKDGNILVTVLGDRDIDALFTVLHIT